MYFEVENSGVCERKGLVQVRYCLYLEPGDARYDEFYVDVPDITEGYTGKEEEYGDWIKALPTKKQLNPFHNHFSYFPDSVTDEDIITEGKRVLESARQPFKSGKTPDIKPVTKPVFLSSVNATKQTSVNMRVSEITAQKMTDKKILG